jgi:hypothetical protein
LIPFGYQHGLTTAANYQNIQQYCVTNPNQDLCNQALNVFGNNINDIDIYDIYGECYHQRPAPSLLPGSTKPRAIPPCIDSDNAIAYLNLDTVKQAIHVQPSITWEICSDILNYTNTVNSVIPIYQSLMNAGANILVYSGDTDGAVPYVGTYAWISSLNLTVAGRNWEPWTYTAWDGDQVAGFVTEYAGITFTTIRGSGHMVPQFRPQAAFYMFQRFVQGLPL